MDKSLFFLTLCLCCIWLMVDSAIGNDRLGAFLGTVFPFMGGGSSIQNSTTETVNVGVSSEYSGSGGKIPSSEGFGGKRINV